MAPTKSRFTTEQVTELSLSDYTHGSPATKKQFVDDLFLSMKHCGFIILRDHPIDEDLLAHAYDLSERLFNLPETKKMSYVSTAGAGQRGYTPFGKEHAKDSPYPDLKEFWHVGRDWDDQSRFAKDFPPNIWPTELTEFKPIFKRIYDSLDGVGRIILRALAPSLDVAPDYFDKIVNQGNSILRLLHYPPIPVGADPNCVRAAAHEDINLITILVSASASGLELKTREGKWLPIETKANNLILDSGDMLARITNDLIPATTHRVVNPKGPNTHRYSMPFFMHPNPDAMLTCIKSCIGSGAKYPDINAEDFLRERLREIGLLKQ